jgi:hypothetical protein
MNHDRFCKHGNSILEIWKSTLYVTTFFALFQEWTKLAADAHESMLQLAVFQICAVVLIYTGMLYQKTNLCCCLAQLAVGPPASTLFLGQQN